MYLPEGKPKRLTVTFPKPTYDTLQEVSDEWHISIAEVVRLAVKTNLKDYLRSVRFVDSEQAKKIADNQAVIDRNICILFNAMQEIRNQLRGIGINYNQQLKLLHEQKNAGKGINPERTLLDENAVAKQVERFETAAAEVGEKLCRCQR